jgi:hypothetical protein
MVFRWHKIFSRALMACMNPFLFMRMCSITVPRREARHIPEQRRQRCCTWRPPMRVGGCMDQIEGRGQEGMEL